MIETKEKTEDMELVNSVELNKTYNEDCLETMKRVPNDFVDLIVTSPPYDNLREYNGYEFYDIVPYVFEFKRILKNGGVVVWVVSDQTKNGSESTTSFRQAISFIEKGGFLLHDTMIYYKEGLTLNHNRYEQEFEYMFVFSKGKPKTFNPIMVPCVWFGKDSDRTGQKLGVHNEIMKKARSGKDRTSIKAEKIKGNVWKYNTGYGHSTKDKIAFKHPAIFPEQLAADHIKSWSNEGDLVYDPFMGSGTTGKMAVLLNRNYIGSEISAEYTKIANDRIKNISNPLF